MRPLAAVIAVGLCVALAPLAGVSQALAAALPSSPTFARSIDAYPRYEPPAACAATDKPGPQALRALLQRTYGSRSFGISRPCSGSATSDHHEGRALDWMANAADPVQRDTADTLIAWLLAPDQYGNQQAMARRLGLAYIIWNNQIYRMYDVGRGWQPYTGSSPHTDHVHFSFSWAGAWARTSWYGWRVDCYVPPASTQPPPAVTAGLGYTPVTPVRLVDSRIGLGTPGPCTLAGNSRLDVAVAGAPGLPPSGIAAAVLNVTAVDAEGETFLGAFPSGIRWPGTSSVNVPGGGIAAATVVVPVGSDGMVSLASGSGRLDVVVDLVGYHALDGSGDAFTPVTPTRVMDSRPTSIFARGETRQLALAGAYGIPADATGVVVNVTASQATGPGYVTLSPSGEPRPTTSSINFVAGVAVANRAYARLGDGSIDLFAATSTHVIIDLVGWFGPGGETRYLPVTPTRIVDSRTTGSVLAALAADPQVLPVAGRAGVPGSARAVVATLTGTRPSELSWAAAWPAASEWPGTSDLNLPPYGTAANLVVAPLSATGAVSLRVGAGRMDAIVDVLGYFG